MPIIAIRWGRHRTLASLHLLLLLLLVPTHPAAAQTSWQVSYVVRPAMGDDALDVTVVLLGDVGGGIVWRTAETGDRKGVQTRPEAQDGFGQPLRVASHPRGWTVTGGSGGGMRLSYRVTAPAADPVGTDGVGIDSESVFAAGHELFLVPDPRLAGGDRTQASAEAVPTPLRVEVVFDVPVSWRIVVPWDGFGRSYRPRDLEDLWSAIVALGDFRRHSVRSAGIDLTVGIQGGEPSRDASVIEAMRRVLSAGQTAFGTLPSTSLTVVLPRHASGGSSAVRRGDSVALTWNWRGPLPGDVNDLHRMARELLRVWHGPGLEGPAWYVQGATDYLAWLVLLRQNLVQRDVFSQQLLLYERSFLSHPRAEDWTFAQEEARTVSRPLIGTIDTYPGDPSVPSLPSPDQTGSLARSRGVLVALAMDATIARLSRGEERLTGLMRKVHLWHRRSGDGRITLQNADLMAIVATLTGGDYLDAFFAALIHGVQPPPTVQALADIIERERGG